MNAVTAPIPNPKSADAKAHEPSMEEILASIRRIIADDQALPLTPRPTVADLRAVVTEPAGRAPAPPEPPRRSSRPRPDGREAELMSKLAGNVSDRKANEDKAADRPAASEEAAGKQAASAAKVEPFPAAGTQRGSVAAPAERTPAAAPQSAPTGAAISSTPSDQRLLSPTTDASVASSFNALAGTVFLQNSGQIEKVAREMLRPMLQRWLDDNLPMIVERLVRAEIERVARGGRS